MEFGIRENPVNSEEYSYSPRASDCVQIYTLED